MNIPSVFSKFNVKFNVGSLKDRIPTQLNFDNAPKLLLRKKSELVKRTEFSGGTCIEDGQCFPLHAPLQFTSRMLSRCQKISVHELFVHTNFICSYKPIQEKNANKPVSGNNRNNRIISTELPRVEDDEDTEVARHPALMSVTVLKYSPAP